MLPPSATHISGRMEEAPAREGGGGRTQCSLNERSLLQGYLRGSLGRASSTEMKCMLLSSLNVSVRAVTSRPSKGSHNHSPRANFPFQPTAKLAESDSLAPSDRHELRRCARHQSRPAAFQPCSIQVRRTAAIPHCSHAESADDGLCRHLTVVAGLASIVVQSTACKIKQF